MTKEVFYHRENAISELRTSLIPSSKVSNDAAILTLCFLMAIEVGLYHSPWTNLFM
jgi:hypothetical protein